MDIYTEIIPVVVNFTAVVLVLYFSTRKSAALFLKNRTEQIEKSILEAEALSNDASVALTRWEGNWKALEAHTKLMYDDAKQILSRTKTEALEKAKHEGARIRREAQLVEQSEVAKVKQSLQRELAHRSIHLVQNHLQTHLSNEDRHKLVSEYAEIVGNGKG